MNAWREQVEHRAKAGDVMTRGTASSLPDLTAANGAVARYSTKLEFVAALLREAIVSGTLVPGQRLRQEEVAQQLGLSWTPVREAFRLLEAEGWVESERHRGAVVASLSLSDFEDIYLLRLANEPLAARLSAERADGALVDALTAQVERMHALDVRQPDNWWTFLRLEREFHNLQYTASGRPRLCEVVLNLRDQSERYLRASFSLPDEPALHQQVHLDLLAAFRNRDSAMAAETIAGALNRVLTRTRPVLARRLESRNGSDPAGHREHK